MHPAVATQCTVMWIDLWTSRAGLLLLGWLSQRVGGQVQSRPLAVDELPEVAGQPFLEVVVLGAGSDGPLHAGEQVDAEGHRPHLPAVPLRGVIPALHRPHLAGAGVTGDRLPVGTLPF